jgi:uncharacterized protein (DUF488 family)
MEPPQIFTVGHSTHGLAEFLGILRNWGVQQVADVRRYPGSRRQPWFRRENLAHELPSHGFSYAHLPQLGGRRRPSHDSPNGGWRIESFRAYADHMASAEFDAGIEALQRLARDRQTAVMCAEALWWRCHRRLVADALAVRGWDVRHIGPDGAASAHELTPFALADGDRLIYPPAQTSPQQS